MLIQQSRGVVLRILRVRSIGDEIVMAHGDDAFRTVVLGKQKERCVKRRIMLGQFHVFHN